MTPAAASRGSSGRPSIQVLADRLAAGLARREPGYPLPRPTTLARRFQATPAEIDAAIDVLVRRHLLRRLPTGQVHRAGPAELLVSMDGLTGMSSLIDPMDHRLSCAAVRMSRLRATAEVADALRLAHGTLVCVRRCLWTADGEPAAIVATHVRREHCDLLGDVPAMAGAGLAAGLLPSAMAPPDAATAPVGGAPVALCPGAVRIEIQAPVRSIARRLGLVTGTPAVLVRARLDSVPGAPGAAPRPVALTVLALRADLFRIVLDTHRTGDPAA